jgi:hypothetical protein
LLKHTLQHCVTAARLTGGRALVVDAVDADAADFWRRRGFLPSRDESLVLFRSMADIESETTSQRALLDLDPEHAFTPVRGSWS